MFRQVASVAVLALSAILFLFHEEIRHELTEISFRNAAFRQADFVCRHLHEKSISLDQICSAELPNIALFSPHFARIQESDGEWFRTRGWSYYPHVVCKPDLEIQFMDRKFRCEEDRGIEKLTGEETNAGPP